MNIVGSAFSLSGLSFGISKLASHREQISDSLEKIATGKKINRASDDPSGLIASNTISASQHALEKQIEANSREASLLGAQEGGLSVLADLTIQLDSLMISSANSGGMSAEELKANSDQAKSILTAIDHASQTTTFLGQSILDGFGSRDLASVTEYSVDEETGERVETTYTLSDLPTLMETDPELAQDLADQALSKVSTRRGAIGNRLKSLDSDTRALTAQFNNTADALSQIEDADIAKESAALVRSQILEKATIQTINTQKSQIDTLLGLLDSSTSTAKVGL